jgi:DNA-binding PadR family transcriptional regulator
MIDTVEALILDLLEWIASEEKSYEQVMDAWRTSCPRLPVWEDANDRGLITTERMNGRSIVRITRAGLTLLQQREPLRDADRSEKPD